VHCRAFGPARGFFVALAHRQACHAAAAVAGSSFTITVEAFDQSNHIFTDYTGTVHFTSSDGMAMLPFNSTLTNGTGTFTVTLRTAGEQTITAADTTDASKTGTSDPIDVKSVISITNTDNATTAVPGNTTTYTIVVTNNGSSTVNGILVNDPLPAGVTSATWSGDGHTNVSGSLSDTIASLVAGASVTYTFTVQIDPSALRNLANGATVTDPTGSVSNATDVDILTPRSDVAISQTDNTTTAAPGGSSTYTIRVTNAGPSAVTVLSVRDPLPQGVTSASWTGDGHTNVTGALSDIISSLAPGASVTCTFTIQIDPSATGNLKNTATVAIPAGGPGWGVSPSTEGKAWPSR
jgi:uncharacterized repeat protein (TIGR01451 family)